MEETRPEDISLDIVPAEAEQAQPAEPVDTVPDKPCENTPAEKRRYPRCICATLVFLAISLALGGLAALVAFICSSSSKSDTSWHGVNADSAATYLGLKHVGITKDVHIVDDSAAKNLGQKDMVEAVLGDAPFLRKWFGNPNSKAVHHDGGFFNTSSSMVAGKYELQLQTDGCYHVHEWHPTGPRSQMTLSATLDIAHATGVAKVPVDQSSHGGQWNFIGAFDFEKGVTNLVLSNRESRCVDVGPCYTTFDAFRFVYVAPDCDSQGEFDNMDPMFVFGKISLGVSDATSFVEDKKVPPAIRTALSVLAGVRSKAVSVSLARLHSTSVALSFRISSSSEQQTSKLAVALDSKKPADVALAISEALRSAGLAYEVQVLRMHATLGIDNGDSEPEEAVPAETTARIHYEPQSNAIKSAPSSQPSCMPSTIVNDFDSHLVTSIVSPEAKDLPGQEEEAFRPGRISQKPYFADWFGDILKKDFHHDAAINKGLLQVNYTTPLSEAGCYLLQEWHLGGSKYCMSYMPRRVPLHVQSVHGMQTAYADQSINGGQWNTLGLFQFPTSATILISNNDTDNCEYTGMCYTVFDSLRLVHVGSACDSVDHDDNFLGRMSDLACDAPNSLSQLGYAPSQQSAEASSAEASPVKLLEILSPDENTTLLPGENFKLSWRTEGVAINTDVKISLLYDDENLAAMTYQMTSASGELELRMPSAEDIRAHSSVLTGGNSRFRVRIDVQHVLVELSNGWSNQLYAYSPYFTVKV